MAISSDSLTANAIRQLNGSFCYCLSIQLPHRRAVPDRRTVILTRMFDVFAQFARVMYPTITTSLNCALLFHSNAISMFANTFPIQNPNGKMCIARAVLATQRHSAAILFSPINRALSFIIFYSLIFHN